MSTSETRKLLYNEEQFKKEMHIFNLCYKYHKSAFEIINDKNNCTTEHNFYKYSMIKPLEIANQIKNEEIKGEFLNHCSAIIFSVSKDFDRFGRVPYTEQELKNNYQLISNGIVSCIRCKTSEELKECIKAMERLEKDGSLKGDTYCYYAIAMEIINKSIKYEKEIKKEAEIEATKEGWER